MNDCTCVWDSADGDLPAFWSQTWRKARKEYKCYECRRIIAKGDTYECYTGKWETMDTYRTCADCQNIRSSLCCDGFTFGCLWENIEEQIFKETGLTVACVDKLTTPEAKRYLQQRWMEYVAQRANP